MSASRERIVYPPGVRDLSEDISTDDLVRRLKECAQAFQNMAQDDENVHRYEPLANFLISERFLEHKSLDVRLLVACCIADLFRVTAPDAPYKDEYQIKILLEFFIDQLKGLSNPDSPNFKRHFYLLENFSVVKTFNICFDLQDSQRIVSSLFKLMFKVVNDHQHLKLQRIIVDLLCPLINEADVVPAEVLNIIFNHIIEPMKSKKKNACILAQEILRKTASCIGPTVQAYFTNEFFLGEPSVSERLCDLIYELHTLNGSMMALVIPQLENKLKSTDEKERLTVAKLVARIFSETKSNIIEENKSLWTSFLARYNDISPKVRILCVKYVSNFLLHHPESREDIAEVLKQRYVDAEEDVRSRVIATIFSAAKEDITCINEDIISHITERAKDKKFRIRKEVLLGLAKLYKQYLIDSEYINPVAEKLFRFVKNRVLYTYYMPTLEDKFLVERLLHTCLIPFQSPMEKRMKLLYQFYCTIDEKATKAFKEILKKQKKMRTLTNGLLEIIQQKKEERARLLQAKIILIAKNLINAKESAKNITLFCKDLEKNIQLRGMMSILLNGSISCSEAAKKVKEILGHLGEAINPYYTCIKTLLERIVPVLLDKESVKYLVSIAKNSIIEDGVIEAELKLENSGALGLELINALANSYPHYFVDEELFSTFIQILSSRPDDVKICEIVLETLSYISKDLENTFPGMYRQLMPLLEKFIETGTPREAKYAVYTVNKMVNDREAVFGDIIENLQRHCKAESEHFRTALASIGHISYLCHDMFASKFKLIVAQTVVKELLQHDNDFPRGGDELWSPFDSLPEETKTKIEGIKLMVRWLSGLKDMVQPTHSTFVLLNALLENKGDLMQRNYLGPKESSWMRLTAASGFLKLCREPAYTERLEIQFFINFAYVLNDECPEVRKVFAAKLNKGLILMKLPLQFLAIFAIGWLDTRKDFRLEIKQYLYKNIALRREHVRENSLSSDELEHQWPDYALPIVIYLLARAPFFKQYDEVSSLNKIKECLQLFIDALIFKNESYSFPFFKRLLENIKQTKDILDPEIESRNFKLYAVTDLALHILMSKPNIVWKDFPGQPKLNSKFFTEPDKSYSNVDTYLPPDMLNTTNLVRAGFEIKVFDKIKGKNEAKNVSKASASQNKPLSSVSQEEDTPSTSGGDPSCSSPQTSISSNSKTKVVTAASTHSNSTASLSKSKTETSEHTSDESSNRAGSSETKQSETSNHLGTISQTPSVSDVVSESQNQSLSSHSSNFVTNLNNEDTTHSNFTPDQSDTKIETDESSLENGKRGCRSKNLSISKKNHLPKRAVVNRKSARLSFKDDAPSLCSEYSKQNGVLPPSPSAISVDSHNQSDCENVIRPCCVVLKRLEDSPSEISNGNQNSSVSFKRKHNYVDSEDYSSNKESSASSHLSEAPRKRGRPPKKPGNANQELPALPTSKRRRFASTSVDSIQSSRSVTRHAVNSSPKSIPTKSSVRNGGVPKEKKSPVKSKVNNSHNLLSKKMNSIAEVALRDELTAEINEINKVRKTTPRTLNSKQAIGQQNKKINGKAIERRR